MPIDESRSETEVAPEELVARIRAGDARAEEMLIRRYSRSVMAVLVARSGSRETAEDVHQETFCIVLERLRKTGIDNPERVAAFIRRTAINVFIREYRKDARRRTNPDTELVERCRDTSYDQLQALIREEADRAVRVTIQGLSNARDKELLYRFYILQQEKSAICTTLGLTTVHFDRVVSRARKRFRDLIESRNPALAVVQDLP